MLQLLSLSIGSKFVNNSRKGAKLHFKCASPLVTKHYKDICVLGTFTNDDDFVLFFAKEVSWRYVD